VLELLALAEPQSIAEISADHLYRSCPFPFEEGGWEVMVLVGRLGLHLAYKAPPVVTLDYKHIVQSEHALTPYLEAVHLRAGARLIYHNFSDVLFFGHFCVHQSAGGRLPLSLLSVSCSVSSSAACSYDSADGCFSAFIASCSHWPARAIQSALRSCSSNIPANFRHASAFRRNSAGLSGTPTPVRSKAPIGKLRSGKRK
jgi:hypothetical protein